MDTEVEPDDEIPSGLLAAPGVYTVALSKEVDGITTPLSEPVSFTVEPLRPGAPEGADPEEAAEFWREISGLQRSITASSLALEKALKRVEALEQVLNRSTSAPGDLDKELHEIRQTLQDLDERLNGNRSKREVGEKYNPTIKNRLNFALAGTRLSTYGPTPNHMKSMAIAEKRYTLFSADLNKVVEETLPEFERKLSEAGAPWMEGQPLPEE
jgi:septal ring factor EnvC (AmiA/AmiB activator)